MQNSLTSNNGWVTITDRKTVPHERLKLDLALVYGNAVYNQGALIEAASDGDMNIVSWLDPYQVTAL